MSWGVKTTCCKALGVSLGGSGVSIGGVRSLRVVSYSNHPAIGGSLQAVLVADSLSPERNREPNGPKRHRHPACPFFEPNDLCWWSDLSYGHPLKELLLYFAAN